MALRERKSWVNRFLLPISHFPVCQFLIISCWRSFGDFESAKRKREREKKFEKKGKTFFMSFFCYSSRKRQKALIFLPWAMPVIDVIIKYYTTQYILPQLSHFFLNFPSFLFSNSHTKKRSINLLFCVIAIIGRRERERKSKSYFIADFSPLTPAPTLIFSLVFFFIALSGNFLMLFFNYYEKSFLIEILGNSLLRQQQT